jgi:peptide/nickel transport system substrate-binding protein
MKKVLLGLTFSLALVLGAAQAQSDTFVYQTFGGVDSLDPAQAYDTASSVVIENVYETLYQYDGGSVTDYVPTLATGWSANDAGDQFTFELREGVTFHSGNEFTCADVQYTVHRMLVHNPGDSGIWFLAESFLGTDLNADAYFEAGNDTIADYDAYWNKVANAAVCIDDYTVQLNLNNTDPTFFVKMMSDVARIVDKQYAIDNGLWDGTEATWRDWVGVNLREYHLHDNVSGTGAYQLVDWDGETVVAEAFDGYWGTPGSVQNVVIETVEEQSTRLLAVQAGDADRIQVGDRATLAQIRGAEGVTIHEDPSWVSTTVGMIFFNQNINTDNNPDVGSGQLDGEGIPSNFFDDANMRKCFAYSFDQQAFIDQVLQGNGQALTMGLPTSFLGYNTDIPLYTVDAEAAEEACRAAHGGAVWENGFTMTATHNAGNTTRQAALEIIAENIEFLNADFNMDVRSLAWPDYLAHTDEGKGTAFALGWAPSYADSDYFLHPFYHSEGFYAGRTGVNNPEFDALIDDARATTDASERESLYRELGQLTYDEMPMLPYPSPTEFIVTRDNIEGVYLNPMLGGQFMWKDITKN